MKNNYKYNEYWYIPVWFFPVIIIIMGIIILLPVIFIYTNQEKQCESKWWKYFKWECFRKELFINN